MLTYTEAELEKVEEECLTHVKAFLERNKGKYINIDFEMDDKISISAEINSEVDDFECEDE